MTTDTMQALVKKHSDCETNLDLEGVMATLIDHPVYEFYPDRLKLEGQANIRHFYTEHFNKFFPLIKAYTLINETWGDDSACLEYDLYLNPPHSPDRAFRVCVVLTKQGSQLIGERFYVENELARLMAGDAYENFTTVK